MEEKINEIFVKISGRIPVADKLNLGEEAEIKIKGEIVKEERLNNQDGTIDIVCVLKPIEAEI